MELVRTWHVSGKKGSAMVRRKINGRQAKQACLGQVKGLPLGPSSLDRLFCMLVEGRCLGGGDLFGGREITKGNDRGDCYPRP